MTHNCYGNNKYLTAKPKSSQQKPKDSWQNQKAHRIIISCSERLRKFVLAFRFCCEIFVIAMTVVGHREIQISYCKALDTYTVINSKLQHPPSPPIGVWTSSVPGGWRIWTLSGWGGEFEQVVWSLSSWKQVLYLQIWRCLLVSIIYLDFHSTKQAMWLFDSWSHAPDQIQMYPTRIQLSSCCPHTCE